MIRRRHAPRGLATARLRRAQLTAAGVALVLVVVATLGFGGVFSPAVEGVGTAAYLNHDLVGGVRVTAISSGLRPDAPAPTITVQDTDGGRIDSLAAQAISDVLDFWEATELPNGSGLITPPSRAVSYDSRSGTPSASCGTAWVTAANAFYCKLDHTVLWDRGELLPWLIQQSGDMTVPSVLAHEVGHAVQNLDGVGVAGDSVLVQEQQADCYSGAYMAWVAEGSSARFTLRTEDIPNVLRGVLLLADHADIEHAAGAHGNGLERVSAWQTGWTRGVDACAKITADTVAAQRVGLMSDQGATDLMWTEDLALALADQVNAFLGMDTAVSTDGAPCLSGSAPAAYCGDTGVVVSTLMMRHAGTPISPGVRGDGTGAVSLIAALVSPWLERKNAAGDTLTARWCAVGVVARDLSIDRPDGIILTNGDLGEMVSGVINEVERSDPSRAFAAVWAFNQGVHTDDIGKCL